MPSQRKIQNILFDTGVILMKKVLVVDDAMTMRTRIIDILTKEGYRVVGEAENGVQAVEQYTQLRPDLVIMDISMPEMNGIDATRAIMVMDPSALVMMCSAMGQQSMVVESLQAGAKSFVVKPIKPDDFLAKVKEVLEGIST